MKKNWIGLCCCFGTPKFLLKMKLLTFFVFASIASVTANSYSQQTKFNMSLENITVRKVFQEIEDKSEFIFLYSEKSVDVNRKVDVKVENETVSSILDQVFNGTNNYYEIHDRQIAIMSKDEPQISPFLNSTANIVQQKPITGKVTDSKGSPIPGVSVVVKGTATGTVTDNKGNYTLSDITVNSIIQFSFIGMESQEVVIGRESVYNITLSESVVGVDEVVVTGYSSQRKKDITGSVAIADIKAIKSLPSGSAVQTLQGQVSGVNVISSGAPGGSSNIFIRGITSFGNTQPLVLVDGVEGNLSDISANDIESIQVLKDAGAAAIYGVRGSNGVILVTTKKGKSGSTIVTYDAYFGMQYPLSGNPFNMLNSQDFSKLSKIAFPTSELFKSGLPDFLYTGPGVSGTGMAGDPAVDPAKYNFDVSDPGKNYLIQAVNKTGTDWFHEVFKPAPMQQHNLTISGGTDKSNYLFSLNYLNQQGTLINTFQKRYSARINTQYKIKGIRVGENLYAFANENPGFLEQSEGNTISNVYRQMPIIPVYDIKGNFGGMFAGPDLGNAQNPVAMQKRTVNNRSNTLTLVGNAYAEIDFLRNFTARTSVGGSIATRYDIAFAFNRYNDREGSTGLNSLDERSSYDRYLIWTNTISYNKIFGKHNVKVIGGIESNKYQGRGLEGFSAGFFSTDFDYLLLGNGTSLSYNSSTAYHSALFSLFSRLDYSFNDKYLVAATIRRDGSSKFGADKRYGIFPSVSLGWRLSNEPFMKKITWVNDLKIRSSYGILGSQNNVDPDNAFTLFGSSPRSSYYDITGSNTSSQQGFYQTRIGNSSTGWEENIVTNIGFDATILKNKIDLSFEYYKKSINGLLFTLPLPATVGSAAAPVVNIGDIQNKGFDISASYHANLGRDLLLKVGTNVTTYKNLVVKIPDPGYFDAATSRNGYLVRNQIGHPVSSFFGYDITGIFKDDADVANSPPQSQAAPGRFKYRDVSGDGKITTDDRTFIGNPNPDFTYGLNLEFNYKNFDLSAIFYGSEGNQVLNLVKWYTHFFAGFRSGKSNDLLNAWTPQNMNTNIPKIEAAGSFSTSGVPNSFYIENGSFLKLRSLIVGYTLKQTESQKLGINKLRLYLQATNLFTITKYFRVRS